MGKKRNPEANDPSVLTQVITMTLGPTLLVFTVPNVVVCLMYFVVHFGSDLQSVTSPLDFWRESWIAAIPSDPEVWCLVLGIFVWAVASILFLPGRKYTGPPTQNGFIPVYYDSGFAYYLLTMTLAISALTYPNFVSAMYWYQKFSAVAGSLIVLGLLYSFFLFVKGHLTPSPGEHGSSSKNLIFDFYWGMELYPRVGSILDLKMLSNCRFGMMCWQLVVLLCWKAQYEHSGQWNWSMAASAILQTVYIAKFFWWEEGYLKTIDIILDRAGFYICFGCICFVPTWYTLTSLYLVENSPDVQFLTFALVSSVGIGSIFLNYWTDYQRQVVRKSGGKCTIWGRPAKVIRAIYVDHQGRKKTSVLLASGFWGIGRHINYVFELCAALLWSWPGLELDGPISWLPFCYFVYLVGLLVHRSLRDEWKCRQKYGKDWEEYCQLVPYKMVPGIF